MSEIDFDARRKRMVAEQLSGRGIADARVLHAMAAVPRHEFVPDAHRAFSYDDQPVGIGFGQTISQPYIVALMTELLRLQPGERVLEVGSGSGYQAAVLDELGALVSSVEIVPELTEFARGNLSRTGHARVALRTGDGCQGWPERAPFDAAIAACAPAAVPQALADQLREGGRLVMPVGATREDQKLFLMKKINGTLEVQPVTRVRFVPMTGPTRGSC